MPSRTDYNRRDGRQNDFLGRTDTSTSRTDRNRRDRNDTRVQGPDNPNDTDWAVGIDVGDGRTIDAGPDNRPDPEDAIDTARDRGFLGDRRRTWGDGGDTIRRDDDGRGGDPRDIYVPDTRGGGPTFPDVTPDGGDPNVDPEEPMPERANPQGNYAGDGADLPPGLRTSTLDGVSVSGAEFLGQVPDMPGPTFWQITGEELVENRMADLFDSGNPVLQAWQEKTRRAASRYGGQNSLMQQQAAVAGLAEMAFNIASADAQTIARSREFNAAMANQYGLAQQAFVYNALLSDQNYRQAITIQREQLQTQLAIARMQVGAELAGIRANMTIAREQMDHATDMAWLNHGFALEMMGSEYELMMGRDVLQADLNLRNQTTLSDQSFTQQWMLNEQGQGFNLQNMFYGAQLAEWQNSQNFRRQRVLNYDQYRVDLALAGANMITNLGIQEGMSSSVINARLSDWFGVMENMGLAGDSFYLNGQSSNGGGYDYFTFPPPGGQMGPQRPGRGGNSGRGGGRSRGGSNGITPPGTDGLRGGSGGGG